MNAETLRFARRLSDINPYMSGKVEPMPEPHHPHDRIVMAGSAVAAVVLVLMAWAGWLPGAVS
ncbi:MAG: hypothetical protein JWR74_3222 [Polaromonas sp.]|nr:hypothetical protein [Polaromonas sp.]